MKHLRDSMAGSLLLEFSAILPFFLTLMFLGAEYAKLNDEIQRVGYLGRELMSIGIKTCGGLGSIGEIVNCIGDDVEGGGVLFKQRAEAIIREQFPSTPVYLVLHSLGYGNLNNDHPDDWIGLASDAYAWNCIATFGACNGGVKGQKGNMATATFQLNANQVPSGWTNYSTATRTALIRPGDENLRKVIYNRCETYRDPRSALGAGECQKGDGDFSCCGVLAAEIWVKYTPLTPVGEFVRGLTLLFGGTWNDDRLDQGYEIYYAVII